MKNINFINIAEKYNMRVIKNADGAINWIKTMDAFFQLPVDFINEIKDNLDWKYITKTKLPETIIREFPDKVDWEYICINQTHKLPSFLIRNSIIRSIQTVQ